MGKSLNGKELGVGISQRKDGRYEAKFVDRFGKRRSIYARSMTEITRKLREEQYLDEKMLNPVNSKMTLDEWFDEWIDKCKTHCRDTTKRTYRVQYNRMREYLGWRTLSSLNLVILQDAFNKLKSDASRRDCRAVLIDMLNRAVETDLLVKNIAYGINTCIDNDERSEKRILSDDEVKILLETVDESNTLKPFLIIALETGMRMGEILGLTWDCIDFENEMIYIRKTMCYLPNDGDAIYEFHKPKTTAGKRDIPMTAKCKDALLKQEKWKKRVSIRHNPRHGFEDLVFCSKTNNPIHESNVRAAINCLVDKVNRLHPDLEFEKLTPHGLRHTFATKCIKRGMRPKTLQKLLGHSSLQMTMDLYCHVEEDTLKSEMALFEKE